MKSKHSFGVVESLVGIKKMNKGTLLSCFIILLNMTSCKWNDKPFDMFVDTSNKHIQICDIGMTDTDPDGGYIEYVVDENGAGEGEQEKQNSKPKMCEAKNCRNENNCCGLEEVSLRELFFNSFKENICPKGYQCLSKEDKKFCSNYTIPKCYSGFFYDEDKNKCLPNDVNHCGEMGKEIDCTQVAGWLEGVCDGVICKPTQCKKDDYHLYCENEICECEKNSTENCGKHGNVCKNEEFMGSDLIKVLECKNEKCHIVACVDEAHLGKKNDRCVKNTEKECGHYNVDCTTRDGYKSVACVYKNDDEIDGYVCEITECKTEYHFYNGNCEANMPEHCNDHETKCTPDKPFCSYSESKGMYECAAACAEGLSPCNNECVDVKTNSSHCSGCNINCHSQITNSDRVDCVDGVCVVQSCTSGFHVYDNACEADTIEHCGVERETCSEAEHSNSICSDGMCDIVCEDGFGDCDNNQENGCETQYETYGLKSCSDCHDDYVRFTNYDDDYAFPLCIKRDESWGEEEWSVGLNECAAYCKPGDTCALEEVIKGGKYEDAYRINCTPPSTELSGRY